MTLDVAAMKARAESGPVRAAEMRWMSAGDAASKVPSRLIAELSRDVLVLIEALEAAAITDRALTDYFAEASARADRYRAALEQIASPAPGGKWKRTPNSAIARAALGDTA